MSMLLCPECSHEVSNTAVACPNCGHPLSPPVVQTETFISDVPPPVIERETFPRWIFIPLGVLGVLLIFIVFLLMRDGQQDQQNINIKLRGGQTDPIENRSVSQTTAPNEITVPPTSQTETVTVPPSTGTTTGNPPPTSVTEIPADTTKVNDRGKVKIELKVKDRRTNQDRPVSAEKFYLLDKSLDAILREANLDNTTGQSLTQAFGLSVVFPEKYGELNSKALAAINKHIKYDTITDGSGKAEIDSVEPKNYYLFAITQIDNGFALWNSSITIKPGENILNLPANPTVIRQ